MGTGSVDLLRRLCLVSNHIGKFFGLISGILVFAVLTVLLLACRDRGHKLKFSIRRHQCLVRLGLLDRTSIHEELFVVDGVVPWLASHFNVKSAM